jgi:chloride channel protein, CIC family
MYAMRLLKLWRNPSNWSIFRADDRLLLIGLAVVVGICSGLAALVLNRGLMAMFEWLHHLRSYWWAFLLPAAGAAFSSIFLEKIVKEAAGHGVPEVIYSVSRHGGLLRMRSSFSRLISSCLTIGSGGSAGPEAPVVMSGAAIGSNIARFFALNDRQRVTLVGCGAAAAISSIFNAPIAGMVFTVEVILGEWSSLNIIPIAIASVAGTELNRLLQGNLIVFQHVKFNIAFLDILACIGLAVLCAGASVMLTRLMKGMGRKAGTVTAPLWLKAAGGGCIVGLIGMFLPVVLGEGYHSIQDMIGGTFSTGLAFVALAAIAKMVATAFTLSWGGSGGIFAPCLVIGSLTGLVYHRALAAIWPQITWVNEGCFALLGMAGLISGVLQAPLTAIFLVVEITGGYEVVLPLILVSAVSTTLCHYLEPASFYLKELVQRGHLLRPGTDARVLTDLSVSELLETDCVCVNHDMVLRDFIQVFKKSHRNHFPVEHSQTGQFLGMIHLDDLRPYLFNPAIYDAVFVDQIMDRSVLTANLDDDLSDILRQMDDNNLFSMPVVSQGRYMGMISKATFLDKYRKELMVQSSQ